MRTNVLWRPALGSTFLSVRSDATAQCDGARFDCSRALYQDPIMRKLVANADDEQTGGQRASGWGNERL